MVDPVCRANRCANAIRTSYSIISASNRAVRRQPGGQCAWTYYFPGRPHPAKPRQDAGDHGVSAPKRDSVSASAARGRTEIASRGVKNVTSFRP